MSADTLRILQVCTADGGGGAERSALNLLRAYRERGHRSWLAVGRKLGDDAGVIPIPDMAARNPWVRCLDRVVARGDAVRSPLRGVGRATRLLRTAGEPVRALGVALGREDFDYPGSRRLLELTPERPDIVHLHNLHGGYFDLRTLPGLSARVPTVLNLRDAWLLSGHCAYPLGCERWKSGCGQCPDLTIYPAVRRDATAYNWRRKRALFACSRLYVTAPSQWLLARACESMLAPAIAGARVVGNGVDTGVFSPGDRRAARTDLGLDPGARVVMTAANGVRGNVWKDYRSLRAAVGLLGESWRGAALTVLAVGESAAEERVGELAIRFVPFVTDPLVLARYYRAADVYVHAARVESFGNVLLEARACGTPVVSTAVGGIPEHVKGLAWPGAAPGWPTYADGEANGILTAPGDARAMAKALSLLLQDTALRDRLGENAARDAASRWSVARQAERFLHWYREILAGVRAAP